MSLKILQEKDNRLFNRKEVKAALISEITPSRTHILELFSRQFSVPAEHIKIKKIKGNFGTKDFSIEANIYSSDKEKHGIELKKKKEGREVKA